MAAGRGRRDARYAVLDPPQPCAHGGARKVRRGKDVRRRRVARACAACRPAQGDGRVQARRGGPHERGRQGRRRARGVHCSACGMRRPAGGPEGQRMGMPVKGARACAPWPVRRGGGELCRGPRGGSRQRLGSPGNGQCAGASRQPGQGPRILREIDRHRPAVPAGAHAHGPRAAHAAYGGRHAGRRVLRGGAAPQRRGDVGAHGARPVPSDRGQVRGCGRAVPEGH